MPPIDEAKFRGLLEAAPDAMVGVDDTGRIAFASRQAEHLFGYTAAELLGESIEVLVPEPHRAAHPQHRADYFANPATRPMAAGLELQGRRRDGSTFPAEISLAAFETGEGMIVTASIRDASARKAAESELRVAYEQLEAAQVLARIGIWSIDLDTNRVTFSDELRRIVGLAPDEPLPQLVSAITEFISPEDQQRLIDVLTEAPSMHEPFTIEIKIRRTAGDGIVNVYGTTTRAPDGTPTRVWGTAQDVTQQRAAEAGLLVAATALERERETVDQLQQAFLPRLPSVEGVDIAGTYRPAGTAAVVGGDWYDALVLPNGDLRIMIGDVAGHGVSAASLMVQLRMAARALAGLGRGPADTLTALNDLINQADTDGLATAVVAHLDGSTGHLTWSLAGHPPFVLHGREHGTRIGGGANGADGPPVGALPGTRYTERSTTIDHGDLLVLYTDGLVERRTEPITTGLERLRRAVDELAQPGPLPPFCEALCDRLLEDAPQTDDVCLLAIRLAPSDPSA